MLWPKWHGQKLGSATLRQLRVYSVYSEGKTVVQVNGRFGIEGLDNVVQRWSEKSYLGFGFWREENINWLTLVVVHRTSNLVSAQPADRP